MDNNTSNNQQGVSLNDFDWYYGQSVHTIDRQLYIIKNPIDYNHVCIQRAGTEGEELVIHTDDPLFIRPNTDIHDNYSKYI